MDQNDFITKLYLDPVENINSNRIVAKNFRPKEQSKEATLPKRTLPNLEGNNSMGSVIMQNWNTKMAIPPDIGPYLNFPVIADRSKFNKTTGRLLTLPEATRKIDFSKRRIREKGENLIKAAQLTTEPQQTTTVPNTQFYTDATYQDDSKSEVPSLPSEITYTSDKNVTVNKIIDPLSTFTNINTKEYSKTTMVAFPKKEQVNVQYQQQNKKDIIDFSKFNRHLYLRDNDFLYAKRVGGPLEFRLCSYQDTVIPKKKHKFISTGGFNKKKLAPLQLNNNTSSSTSTTAPKVRSVEYITISKNTVLHYQRGVPSVYSIQEWIENYEKYQRLMNISLFKNFKIAKLFDLWRRFFKRTQREYYTEKLTKHFHLIDTHLRKGIFKIRKILKDMEYTNIFEMSQKNALYLNKLTDVHKDKVKAIETKMNNFRDKVKTELVSACNKSYLAFKKLKNITLDDNVSTEDNFDLTGDNANTNDDNNNSNNNNKKKKDEANVQGFLKDAIPYAQDATRKTHYKKLLRYIRVIDYLFNESKVKLIEYSSDKLDQRLQHLYDCYVNKYNDCPLVVTKILCMETKIHYNPPIDKMHDFIFDTFIQEKLNCVIFRKNFVDPQEFPAYMSVFEEVFETDVDQNTNLSNRIKETKSIVNTFNSIKNTFNNCTKALYEYSEELKPILENYTTYNKIDFKELENSATPDELKDLLEKFISEAHVIRKLKVNVHCGIFEFNLEDLIEKVVDAPKFWLSKIRTVIPTVFISKINYGINKLGNYLNNLSVNPSDVESFIKLKKAVEECTKDRKQTEKESNDIMDLTALVQNDKEIKIQDYDIKLQTELKDISVKYERKLDTTSFYIDNNIQKFRLDLKTDIQNFDNQIKGMIIELNTDLLNQYADNTYAALSFLEENNVKISQAIKMKEKYRTLEDDLEIDETQRSNFENLDNLEYDYNLKVDIWNSVKEFQDTIRKWNEEQVRAIDIELMKASIQKWNDLCKVAIVDLDIPNVPKELAKRVKVYDELVPVLVAIQNENIKNEAHLLIVLLDILHIDNKLDEPMYIVQKLLDINDLHTRYDDIIELNIRANEERKLKDLIKVISDGFYKRKLPIKLSFNKKDFAREFEFIEENLMIVHKIYLNKYHDIISKDLERINSDLSRYYNFITLYAHYQEYIFKSDGILENGEFSKEMPAEYKKLTNENLKKNLYKHLKDYGSVERFLENVYDKVINLINSIIQSYEQNYRAINIYLDKKRKEFPKFFLLSDEDLALLYTDKEDTYVKNMLLLKLFPYIKSINIGTDLDEYLTFTSTDDEFVSIKFTKSSRSLKDCIDVIEGGLYRKMKEMYKRFKKEYEDSVKARSALKPKNVIHSTITNKDNLSQNIFNVLYFYMIDCIEKALAIEDQAFDKLFDLYHEVKDERLVSYIAMLKDNNTPLILRKVLTNIVSLENYCKGIIENLIREDVTNVSDYNYMKIIQTKLENDSYIIKMLSINIEYGFEYVGPNMNFIIIPQSERLYLSLANCISLRKPFMMYGINDSGKKETIKTFASLCGKRVIYLNTSYEYNASSFNNTLLGNLKEGRWLCLDRSENIKKECLDVLCSRIMEVYRVIRENEEDELFVDGSDKYQMNIKQMSIFMIRNLPYISSSNSTCVKDDIPLMLKNHFRQIAFPLIDVKHYLTMSLMNYAFKDAEKYASKIIYVISLINQRIQATHKRNITFTFIITVLKRLLLNINEINKDNKNEIIIKALLYTFKDVLCNVKEREDLERAVKVVFNMKDYETTDEPTLIDDNEVNTMISNELSTYKFNSTSFENKLKLILTSLDTHDSFVLLGQPITGKSEVLLLLSNITRNLNKINRDKYAKLQMVKMFPKAGNASTLFAKNTIETAYQFNNNFYHNMLQLFSPENKEHLDKLNEHYLSMLVGKPYLKSPTKLMDTNCILNDLQLNSKAMNSNKETFRQDDEEEEEVLIGGHKLFNSENIDNDYKALIFDGQIDPTWSEYVNSIYSDVKVNTHVNGDNTLMNIETKWKMFYECIHIKHASPSFLTKQLIVNFDYDTFNYENILYSWIETNEKVIANTELKNYIRGLFENFFPKIWDFILNNKYKKIEFNENYSLKVLIAIFNSILPMFNFEDKKIGRKAFNVVPKIELIKKCTLSIFIFSCAWTMLFLSNFVIKTKIEKLISDIFKADDLKGPVFEYFIDDTTNDFEQWNVLLQKDEYQLIQPKTRNEIFYYGNIFIHSLETIPYYWLCDKLIKAGTAVFYNGKENSGKTLLINTLLNKLNNSEQSIKRISMLISHNTTAKDIDDYLMNNVDVVKKDIYGDKYGKEVVFFIDDVNVNQKHDTYESSEVIEEIRKLITTKCTYDSKYNVFKYLSQFNIIACGNVNVYPLDMNFSRFVSKFVFVTQVFSEDAFVSIYKPTLEFHLRQYIPNTSSITATQYIQASLKLNSLLNNEIANDPDKLHLAFSIRDVTRVIQAFHMFAFKGTNEYPEYLKKLFFYESSKVYEDRLTKPEQVKMFRDKICEAYSSVFKQDKVVYEDIFTNWDSVDKYIYCQDYLNDNVQLQHEHTFYNNKHQLYEYIKNKIQSFYINKHISDNNLIRVTNENMNYITSILRVLENKKSHMLLIGKTGSYKNALLHLCAYISNYDVIDVDTTYIYKPQEQLYSEVIYKLLIDTTYNNKKTILFCSSSLTQCDSVLELINKLLNTNELINNFNFVDDVQYGKLPHNEMLKRLENNITIVLDVEPKTITYKHIFLNYPFIVKNTNVIYFTMWKEHHMKSYLSTNIESISAIKVNKPKLVDVFYNIYTFVSDMYRDYSRKLGTSIEITQKQFASACEFYYQKYNVYLELLYTNQKKYNEAIEILNKCNTIINKTSSEIDEIMPGKVNAEKQIEERKLQISQKVLERGNWKTKKGEEEKPIGPLEKEKHEKETQFEYIIQPFRDQLGKALNAVNRISAGDITEIKNTWGGLTFGKFILNKILECLGEQSNLEWDGLKNTVDLKIIKNFANINALKLPKELIAITKEITSHSDFSRGDKYQKPFKACGTLCEYFYALKNFFDEHIHQKELLDEIEQIKDKIQGHHDTIKQYNKNIAQIEKEISDLEQTIKEIDIRKQNINGLLDKKNAIKTTFEEVYASSQEKTSLWQNKKSIIDTVITNYDCYLTLLANFLVYAGPLNKLYRHKLKTYIYSLCNEINNINNTNTDNELQEIPIYELIVLFLDVTGKDSEFCLSLSPFNEFFKENFAIMYTFANKIPLIIDNYKMSKDILTQFLEFKNQKGIVSTVYSIEPHSEMLDKVESALNNGGILYIDQVESNVFDVLRNVIIDNNISTDRHKKVYTIRNKRVVKNEKFKMYFIKNKIDAHITRKCWNELLVVNFNATSDVISKRILNSLASEQDAYTVNLYNKTSDGIAKDNFRLYEIENKIHGYVSQFDFSGNLDKIEKNQNILERFKIEIQTHTAIFNQIEKNKHKLTLYNASLQRYNLISNQSCKIYKWYARYFKFNNMYVIPIDVFCEFVKRFYKGKFGVFTELIKEVKHNSTNKKVQQDDDDDDGDNKGDDDNEEDDEENKQKLQIEQAVYSKIPTYEKKHLHELIMYLFENNLSIYDNNNIKYIILLTLLFFKGKVEETLPTFYKTILLLVKSIYFDNNIETSNYNAQSPIQSISDLQWNALKQLNDQCDNIFEAVLTDIETNKEIWETYLNDKEVNDVHYTKGFVLCNETLENNFNPFLRFVFFSIVKPSKCHLLLSCVIKELMGREYEMSYTTFKKEFEVNLNKNRTPLLLVDNGNIVLDKEIKDYYLPLMKSKDGNVSNKNKEQHTGNTSIAPNDNANNNNTNNTQQEQTQNQQPNTTTQHSIDIIYKEITPSKVELSITEQELIHHAIKNGGVIVIKNCHILKESLNKLCEELRDPNTIINDYCKLIFVVPKNTQINSYLYNHCRILNTSSNASITQIKDHVIELIKHTPDALFNRFINRKGTSCSLYMKKLYVLTLLFYSTLIHVSRMNVNRFKIPIDFCERDFITVLSFIDNYISTVPEDKVVQYSNNENDIGFTYGSIVNVIMEGFIHSRLIYKSDSERVGIILAKLYNEDSLMKDNTTLYKYNEVFEIDCDFDNKKNNDEEQLYTGNEDKVITHNDLIDKFNMIPYESYEELLFSVNKELIRENDLNDINYAYETMTNAILGKELPLKHKIHYKTTLLVDRIQNIKVSLPDPLNVNEGYPLLFKVNKLNDYINPLDSSLITEMNNYNNYVQRIQDCIDNLLLALKRETIIVNEYSDILTSINENKVPLTWLISVKDKGMIIPQWLELIKERYAIINEWISHGGLKVYDANMLMNKNLFMSLLQAYFIRKVNDDKTSPDKVKLKFKFTKACDEGELSEEMVEQLEKKNNNKEMLFIKGLVIKGGKYDVDKEMLIETTNVNDIRCEQKCPIVCVSYDIEEYEEEGEEEEEQDDEESEEEEVENKDDMKKQMKDKVNETQQVQDDDEDESIQVIHIPFFESDTLLNENNYLMRVPYGYFKVKIDKDIDNAELIFKARSINVLFEK